MKNISDQQDFIRSIENTEAGLTLVDFNAKWCAPCKILDPIVNQIAEQYEGSLQVLKVDADNCQETAAKYGVRGLPTLMLFKDGVPVATKVGSASFQQVDEFVSEHFKHV